MKLFNCMTFCYQMLYGIPNQIRNHVMIIHLALRQAQCDKIELNNMLLLRRFFSELLKNYAWRGGCKIRFWISLPVFSKRRKVAVEISGVIILNSESCMSIKWIWQQWHWQKGEHRSDECSWSWCPSSEEVRWIYHFALLNLPHYRCRA